MACEQLDRFISPATLSPASVPQSIPRDVGADGVLIAPFGRLTRSLREAICARAAARAEAELGHVIAQAFVEARVDWRLVPLDEIKRLVVDAARASRQQAQQNSPPAAGEASDSVG